MQRAGELRTGLNASVACADALIQSSCRPVSRTAGAASSEQLHWTHVSQPLRLRRNLQDRTLVEGGEFQTPDVHTAATQTLTLEL